MELAFRTAIPVDDVDYMMLSPTEGMAIVWLDISDRPDLAILSKSTPLPNGFSVITWFYRDPGKHNMKVGLHLAMKQPSRFAINIVLPVKDYIDQLTRLGQHGNIWFVVGPPPDHLRGSIEMTADEVMTKVVAYSGAGLLIQLDQALTTEIRQRIDEWRRRRYETT